MMINVIFFKFDLSMNQTYKWFLSLNLSKSLKAWTQFYLLVKPNSNSISSFWVWDPKTAILSNSYQAYYQPYFGLDECSIFN